MAQRVNSSAPVEAVSLTPLGRVVRTIVQTVIAVGASVPIILAATPLTGPQITKVEAIIAGLVAAASVIQNVLENLGVIPVAAGFVNSLSSRRLPRGVPIASTTVIE